jgi:hypothetical protein
VIRDTHTQIFASKTAAAAATMSDHGTRDCNGKILGRLLANYVHVSAVEVRCFGVALKSQSYRQFLHGLHACKAKARIVSIFPCPADGQDSMRRSRCLVRRSTMQGEINDLEIRIKH